MSKRSHIMQLEALEARQLLATVVGGGEEVGSDISFQGNTYDQILMTGASVSVSADAGQIVRVSAIDSNDDIVQYEFSGSGTMSISLDDFEAAAAPVNYEQDVEYVKGTASITIEGSDSSTNVSVSTVGEVTSPVFSTLDNGADLDGVADIARITIVADPTNPGGSTFGGIRTANARFADDSGIVGISGANVAVQGPVIIGDIDASDTGVPSLVFGANSQFGTLQVAGGDLAQTNGANIEDNGVGNFHSVNFIAGTTSDNVAQDADVMAGTLDGNNNNYNIATLDATTAVDLDGLNQSDIDAIFDGVTFTGDVTVTGDLEAQYEISAAAFRGDLTLDGELEGAIDITGDLDGDIILAGVTTDTEDEGAGDRANSGNITIGGDLGGSFVTGAAADTDAVDYSGTLRALAIGGVDINGDFSGLISTDKNNSNDYTVGEGAIGDVNVTGDVAEGEFEGITGIGNITIGGDITETDGNITFWTSGDTGGDDYLANIGTLTVTGDVNVTGVGYLIAIAVNGNFGDIALNGGGTSVGYILANGDLGADTTGSITITGGTTAGVAMLGVFAAEDDLGAITVTGDGTSGTSFVLDNAANTGIVADTGDVGAVTISGFDTITLTDGITSTAADIGNISFDANSATDDAGTVTLTDGWQAGGDTGTIAITADTINIDGTIAITGTAGDITLTGDADVDADTTAASMGAYKVDGDADFANNIGILVTGATTSFEVTGDAVLLAGASANIQVGSIGDITIGGGLDMSGSSVASIDANDGTSALDAIGDISIGGLTLGANDVFDISASSIGDITISAALTASSESLVTDLSVSALPNSEAGTDGETVETDGSDLGNYSIGNITVENTNTIGIASTSLFDSTTDNNNVFLALGAIGDITLSGGGSENVQTSLFKASTDGAVFYASGASNGDYNELNTASIIYWDGNTGTAETYSDLSGGTVTIGNVYINTASAAASSDPDTIHDAQGDNTTTAWSGLNIFAGVTAGATAMDNAFDDVSGNTTLAGGSETMVAQDADLSGTIGTITVTNKTQQLTVPAGVDTAIANAKPETASDYFSGIVAATSVGAINGASYTADASGEWVEIGAASGGAADTMNEEELIVYIA